MKSKEPASHSDRIKAMAEHHPHKAEDKKAISKLAAHHRKAGGPAKKGGKTQVNVVVAGRGGNGPSGAPSAPPMPVRAPAPPPPMGGPVPPVGGGGLGAMAKPPMPGAKKGGAVKPAKRAHGGSVSWQHAGAGAGEGRLEKERAYGAKSKTKDSY